MPQLAGAPASESKRRIIINAMQGDLRLGLENKKKVKYVITMYGVQSGYRMYRSNRGLRKAQQIRYRDINVGRRDIPYSISY